LLGLENNIPAGVQEAFQRTGTAHIVAISGYNMSLLSGLCLAMLVPWLGRWRGLLAAVVIIGLYTLFVGAAPPVVRAAFMGSIAMLGHSLGRRGSGVNAVGFVMAVMVAIDPDVLWQPGFQLSVTATLGLVLYADPLERHFLTLLERYLPESLARRLARLAGEYFLFTLAAQAAVLPVIAYHFRRISWTAVLTNPLVLPLQPPLMILGGLSLIAGLFYVPIGSLFAQVAWPFAALTIRLVELFGSFRGGEWILAAAVPSAYEPGWVFLVYLLLVGAPLTWSEVSSWVSRAARSRLGGMLTHVTPTLVVLLLAALVVTTWRAVLGRPDGRLHLTVLNCGQGEALLVQTPQGRAVLINGGSSSNQVVDELGRRIPAHLRALDWLVIAATGEDYLAALPAVVERFPPKAVLWAGPLTASRSARELQRIFAEQSIPVHLAQGGQSLDLGDGARLQVVTAGARGAVLLLEWQGFRTLIPSGVDFEMLESLSGNSSLESITTLLLADSGSARLNPPGWIIHLDPRLILLSAAADDRRGLPDGETLQAIEAYTLLRTDRNGWIELITDGRQLWVQTEKK
jgi:competence protein ComEC